jgi:CHAD domain-containing protein
VGLKLFLDGPNAAEDAAQALAKADLWQRVFGEALQIGMVVESSDQPVEEVVATPLQPVEGAVSAGEAATEATAPAMGAVSEGEAATEVTAPVVGAVTGVEAATGVTQPLALPASEGDATSDDRLEPWYASSTVALAELGRILLRRHLRRLRSAEREVRANTAVEAVHDLRVATRRLRSTLHLLAPVYAGDNWRALNRGVGQIGRAAGAVRDRDVLIADLATHASALPAEALADLQQRLSNERAVAHAALINFLDDERYTRFIRRFARVMNDLSVWDNRPRVRDLGASTIWRHYEALRAHDQHGLPAAIEDLHLMRIGGKHMRYVLELFTDTLGPRVDELVQPLVLFQDHLGVLNDIVVAGVLLAPHADDVSTGPAVMGYIALREQQANNMLAELPACWAQLASEAYRSRLAGLIVQL